LPKIHSELRTIWITPDGFKFFNKEDAEMHCEEFHLLETNNEGEIDAEEI
tara:strand:+ start:410 stop:559 length:150 start_codon:yes stop_codon:yes gene_type:complete